MTDWNAVLKDVVLSLYAEERQRVLESGKQYLVIYLSHFNAGSVATCVCTDNMYRYQHVTRVGNYLIELETARDIIEDDIKKNRDRYIMAENISGMFKHLEGKANRRAIFKHYRYMDGAPATFPFADAAEKAIRKLFKFEKVGGYYLVGLELCLWLDNACSEIVNSSY